jgi:hypothetical protein
LLSQITTNKNTKLKGNKKMLKNLTGTMTLLLLLGLLVSTLPLFVSTSIAAESSSQPNSFIEYSNAYGIATLNVPSIGNITRMTVAAIHQEKSSTIDNYEVMSFTLSSSLTTGTVTAVITTNFNPEDISWRKALRNGTSIYTEINGNVTINNSLRVTANELKVQKTGTRYTVDFNPQTPAIITLPRNLFPSPNFTATWTLPAFHMDFDANGSTTLANSTTANPISGWTEYNEYATANANFTFACPSWSNYTTSGTGTIRPFAVHRGQAPGTPVVSTEPLKRIDFYDGFGQTQVDIPKTGNITRMLIQAMHAVQGPFGDFDILIMTLSATGYNGSVQARINNSPESVNWIRSVVNGTSAYTEVNGNVLINNIFPVSANELKVQRNGTRLTVDFNPATPVNVMLPSDVFPRANFSATWTIPAFRLEFNVGNQSQFLVSTSTTPFPSGWTQTNDYFLNPANATIAIPSWGFTTTVGTNTYVFPYLVAVMRSPYLSKAPAVSAFSSATVMTGQTWYFFAHYSGGVVPYKFQWYEGTAILASQTSMLLPVTKTTAGIYTYTCQVMDADGNTASSNAITLTVLNR